METIFLGRLAVLRVRLSIIEYVHSFFSVALNETVHAGRLRAGYHLEAEDYVVLRPALFARAAA